MTLPALAGLHAVLRVLRKVPAAEAYAAATDAELLEAVDLVGGIARLLDAHRALAAGRMAERSRPDLGAGGSHVEKARAPPRSSSRRPCASRGARPRPRSGWAGSRHPTARSRRSAEGSRPGALSIEAADAIRGGLGEPAGLDGTVFARAVDALAEEAGRLDPDRLRKRARELRDELDEAGVADREERLRSRRSLRRIDVRDGMKRLIWGYDPETAGIVDEVYDRATSPRRGGPRFVDAAEAARAADVERDPPHDRAARVGCLRGAPPTGREQRHLGAPRWRPPGVRILVSADALGSATGYSVAEGSGESFSPATVERPACANGTRTVLLDSLGDVLDLGREQRLYSRRQRLALAARDGGCMWPACDRPPSWCEAHHIDHWARDGGRTDLGRGILLCRHHHLRLHNEGWRIVRWEGRFRLEPPAGSRHGATVLETKSRAVRDLLRRRSSTAGAVSPPGGLAPPAG